MITIKRLFFNKLLEILTELPNHKDTKDTKKVPPLLAAFVPQPPVLMVA